MVTEPRSGRFFAELSPGDDVQAAVDACPEGGAILLTPGHYPLVASPRRNANPPPAAGAAAPAGSRQAGLWIDRDVCVFGRGAATLESETGDVIIVTAARAVLDGLHVRQASDARHAPTGCGVLINGGRSRLQSCDISSECCFCVEIGGAETAPTVINCRCALGLTSAIYLYTYTHVALAGQFKKVLSIKTRVHEP